MAKRTDKPYTQRQARRLLGRLVAMANDVRVDPLGAARKGLAAERAALVELLTARLGDVRIRGDIRSQLDAVSDDEIWSYAGTVSAALRQVMREDLSRVPLLVVNDSSTIVRILPDLRLELVVSGIGPNTSLQIIGLVQLVGKARLRTCPCGRLFVKVRRQEFCSKRCQTREYMRRYRAQDRKKVVRHGQAKRVR